MGTIEGPVTSTTRNGRRVTRPPPDTCRRSGISGTSRSILQHIVSTSPVHRSVHSADGPILTPDF
ncbi:hypothetical protein GCM10010342_12650 [Streptomyces anulatus]|nr:hypothetical protein GCM10010342_12650 [Streptomyces anulatus]